MGNITSKALRELQGAIDGRVERKAAKPVQTVTGTVTGAKAGALRVLVDGAAESTPAETSACDVSVGDSVTCVISDGSMSITGNTTAPATSQKAVDATVAPIVEMASTASSNAASASKLATTAAAEAAEISETLGQHFWSDDSGAHVTDVAMEDWQTAEASDFPDASDTKQYSNILLNSLGMLIRAAKRTLVSVSRSAISFFDGSGSDAANVVASFGADGAQIGRAGESHIEQDYHSFKMADKNGNTYVYFSDLRNEDGYYDYTQDFSGLVGYEYSQSPTGYYVRCSLRLISDSDDVVSVTLDGLETSEYSRDKYFGPGLLEIAVGDNTTTHSASVTLRTRSDRAKAFTLGSRNGAVESYSVAIGQDVEASAQNSIALGENAAATNKNAIAIGTKTSASNVDSVAIGYGSIASNVASVAIGLDAKATEIQSFAIGDRVTATGFDSFALGVGATASKHDTSIKAVSNINLQSPVKAEGTLDVAGAATLNGGFAHTANSVALTYPLAWLDALADGIIETSTASEILVAESGTTITSAHYKQWGRVASMRISFTRTSAITVPAHGNITDIDVATVVSGKRPRMMSFGYSDGNGAGQAWYRLGTDGTVTLCACEGNGSSRSIAKGSAFSFYCTYILD